MADKFAKDGPQAMSATLTTNIHQGGGGNGGSGGSALIRDIIRHIHVTNKTAGAVTFSLWIGATGGNAAGTEFINAQSVAANSSWDWYGALPMVSTDYLVGGASAGTSLAIELEYTQQVV